MTAARPAHQAGSLIIDHGHLDDAFLSWTGRFRFVTAELLGTRFSISSQQANSRIRRLTDHGLLARSHHAPGSSYLVALTRKGARSVGLPERRPPRGEVQRRHELAVVALATAIETTSPHAVEVITEREARHAQAHDPAARYSVTVQGAARGDRRRWPDLILRDSHGTLTAIEVELTLKGTARLTRILTAYRDQNIYPEVIYRTPDPRLARHLSSLLERLPSTTPPALRDVLPHARGARITVIEDPTTGPGARAVA